MSTLLKELDAFLEEWKSTEDNNKQGFEQMLSLLQGLEGCAIEFHQRPGITYSLRGTVVDGAESKLFVMVDVIEDTPRWLSVCFYGKMITDPEERGAFVPGGLLGEDAVCFDIDEFEQSAVDYVTQRIKEAHKEVEG